MGYVIVYQRVVRFEMNHSHIPSTLESRQTLRFELDEAHVVVDVGTLPETNPIRIHGTNGTVLILRTCTIKHQLKVGKYISPMDRMGNSLHLKIGRQFGPIFRGELLQLVKNDEIGRGSGFLLINL